MNVDRMRKANRARRVRGRWTQAEVNEIWRRATERFERVKDVIE